MKTKTSFDTDYVSAKVGLAIKFLQPMNEKATLGKILKYGAKPKPFKLAGLRSKLEDSISELAAVKKYIEELK